MMNHNEMDVCGLSPRRCAWLAGCLLVLIGVLLPGRALAQQAGLFDALEPLYPDTGAHHGAEVMKSVVPRGGVAAVHVLIDRVPTGGEVEVVVKGEPGVAGLPEVAELLPVTVAQNTGLHTRTELLDGRRNPHVIRRAPFEVYDAIRPAKENKAKADASGRLALRLEFDAAVDAAPGERVFEVVLRSKDAPRWSQTLEWRVYVHQVVVPDAEQPAYTNWYSVGQLARAHGHERWSEGHWAMIASAAKLMRDNRQTMFRVVWGDFLFRHEGTLQLNFERLDRYMAVFKEEGFEHVELGRLAHRENGDWNAAHLVTQIGNKRVDAAEGQAQLVRQLELIGQVIERYELEGKVWQHVSDEPLDAHSADYRLVADLVHQHLPGVPVFDATHATKSVVDAIDVWCPQLDHYWHNYDFYQERLGAGEQVWLYTCLSPGGADLNRLLDQERTRCVLLGWLIARDGLSGYLHWGFNHYRPGQDPYRNTTPQFDNKPGPSRNFLPAGDTHVAYPDPDDADAILGSVRLAAHRVGMEDAALLRRLQADSPDIAGVLIGKLIHGPKRYAVDVETYRAVRQEMLDLIAG